MKTILKILALTVFLCASAVAYADGEAPGANVAFGLLGFYGASDLRASGLEQVEFDPGICGGGGLVVEKMFSNRFGIHTGLQYEYSRNDFLMNSRSGYLKASWNFHKTIIPVMFITSFSTESFSINFLAGLNYCNIFRSRMKTNTTAYIDTHNDDALKIIHSHQFGASGGINLKFRFTRFTEMFAGVLQDYYFTDAFDSSDSKEKIKITETRLITGWMFRTDIFPMETDD